MHPRNRSGVDNTRDIFRALCALRPDTKTVPRDAVHRAIALVISADPRMLKKYTVMLEVHGYLRHKGFTNYEICQQPAPSREGD